MATNITGCSSEKPAKEVSRGGATVAGCTNLPDDSAYSTRTTRPCFFRILTPNRITSLDIPVTTSTHICADGEVPGLYALRGPSGNEWKVRVAWKDDGPIVDPGHARILCFMDGWGEFVKDHGLRERDLVVLEFDAPKALFYVLVFDRWCCDKVGAFRARPSGSGVVHGSLVDDPEGGGGDSDLDGLCHGRPRGSGVSVEEDVAAVEPATMEMVGSEEEKKVAETVLGESEKKRPGRKRRAEVAAPSSMVDPPARAERRTPTKTEGRWTTRERGVGVRTGRRHGRLPSSVDTNARRRPSDSMQEASANDQTADETTRYSSRGRGLKGNRSRTVLVSRRRQVSQLEISRAWRAAISFSSGSPFFLRIMKKSYIYNASQLRLPASFASKHFRCRAQVTLLVAADTSRSWEVSVVPSTLSTLFSAGWRDFAIDNNLEEEDACVFELVRCNVLHVHIFRVVEEVTPLEVTTVGETLNDKA